MDKATFTNLFDSFDRTTGATKYQPLRQSARARFRALPLPSPRTEDWRFTSVAPIVETPFELPGAEPALAAQALPPLATPDAIRLVFVNGHFALTLSALGKIPPGVQVGSLADANTDAVRSSLAQIAGYQDDVFTALNTSFLCDGAYLLVPHGKVIEQPIEIIYVSRPDGRARATASFPRTWLVFGTNTQATVVERYFGEGVYLTNAVTEIVLAERAIIDHVKLQDESTQAYHIANTQVVQAGQSRFTTHTLSFGSAIARNEVRVRFDGEHAEATVNGLYVAAGKQHIDNYTAIDHAKPNCVSHEMYKGILADHSHGVFNGKIFVRKDAQKTDAKQTNKVLLLSDGATINTKPQLEIFADDVKCTHGATIGQLDASQLFYLQSRGIPLEAARRLLTFAFANDVVGRLKIETMRNELEARIVQ